MAFLIDDAKDALLAEIRSNIEALHICSSEPSNHTEATDTYSLGYKTSPSVTAIGEGSPDGRQFQVEAITDGVVDGSDTAGYYALVDNTEDNEELLVAQSLDETQVLTSGNTFTLGALTFRVPDPS